MNSLKEEEQGELLKPRVSPTPGYSENRETVLEPIVEETIGVEEDELGVGEEELRVGEAEDSNLTAEEPYVQEYRCKE